MIKITKDNIESFLEYYHDFHDSIIDSKDIEFKDNVLTILIDIYWRGKPILKENGFYEKSNYKLKLKFSDIKEFNFKNNDYSIDEIYFKIIKDNNEEYFCFADDEKEPYFYIICKNIEYEEIKK